MEQRFEVHGMSCAHCVKAVTRAVQGVDPGATVEVDLPGARVTVRSEADRQRIAAAIREEGYTVAG
jgi:copper chaperone